MTNLADVPTCLASARGCTRSDTQDDSVTETRTEDIVTGYLMFNDDQHRSRANSEWSVNTTSPRGSTPSATESRCAAFRSSCRTGWTILSSEVVVVLGALLFVLVGLGAMLCVVVLGAQRFVLVVGQGALRFILVGILSCWVAYHVCIGFCS